MADSIRINPKDNVVTVVRPIAAGEAVDAGGVTVTARQDIPVYHKMAVTPIPKGGPVYKYGEIIGTASADIEPGDWAHVHNIDSNRGRGDRK